MTPSFNTANDCIIQHSRSISLQAIEAVLLGRMSADCWLLQLSQGAVSRTSNGITSANSRHQKYASRKADWRAQGQRDKLISILIRGSESVIQKCCISLNIEALAATARSFCVGVFKYKLSLHCIFLQNGVSAAREQNDSIISTHHKIHTTSQQIHNCFWVYKDLDSWNAIKIHQNKNNKNYILLFQRTITLDNLVILGYSFNIIHGI